MNYEEFSRINQFSWELAIMTMMWNEGKFRAYSRAKIRELLTLVQSPDYQQAIARNIDEYKPQSPTRLVFPTTVRMSENEPEEHASSVVTKQKELHGKLSSALIKMATDDHSLMGNSIVMKYTLWDIGILEQTFENAHPADAHGRLNRIEKLLDAEAIPGKERIISLLKKAVDGTMNQTNVTEKRGEN